GDEMPLMEETLGNEAEEVLLDEPIEEKGEGEETIDHNGDAPKETFETDEVEKRKRPSRTASKSQKCTEPKEDSEGEDEPSLKKTRSESFLE
ncbi:hypothetical protein PENTCL1PPCAC_19459, partial [Pristionchus entomophagus]